jgi:hypothetical protein
MFFLPPVGCKAAKVIAMTMTQKFNPAPRQSAAKGAKDVAANA